MISYFKKLILNKENNNVEKVCQNYIIANIISLAICKAIAIYGLVIVFLSKDISHYYLFMVISLVGFFIYFPRKNELEDMVIKI